MPAPARPRRSADPIAGTEIGLDELAVGARARIVGISADGAAGFARRLGDLGFAQGTSVEALRRAPLGDPVVYRVCGYELCLRSNQARFVRVVGIA